jgi:Tfp pilus assembly protein PilE
MLPIECPTCKSNDINNACEVDFRVYEVRCKNCKTVFTISADPSPTEKEGDENVLLSLFRKNQEE